MNDIREKGREVESLIRPCVQYAILDYENHTCARVLYGAVRTLLGNNNNNNNFEKNENARIHMILLITSTTMGMRSPLITISLSFNNCSIQ